MVDPRTLRRWLYRLGFLALAAFVAFLHLLPLRIGAGGWPGPDLLLAFAFAWVLRRPDYVPVALVAAVMLLSDFLFLRPPGLWAALAVLGLEFLRRREPTSRDMPFVVEWAMVAGVMLGMAAAYRLVLAVFMVQQASLGLTLIGQIATVAAYPAVVLVSVYALKITKITPIEADELRAAA